MTSRAVQLLVCDGFADWELAGLGTPVAAICAGRLAVARAGLLDDRRQVR